MEKCPKKKKRKNSKRNDIKNTNKHCHLPRSKKTCDLVFAEQQSFAARRNSLCGLQLPKSTWCWCAENESGDERHACKRDERKKGPG